MNRRWCSAREHRTPIPPQYYPHPTTVCSSRTSASARSRPSLSRSVPQDQLVLPGPLASQDQAVPWQGQWCQWAPWPQAPVPPGLRSVVGASQAQPTSPPWHRDEAVGTDPPAPTRAPGQDVELPAQLGADDTAALTSSAPDDSVAPLPPVSQEDFKAHQELLRRVALNLQLQAEEMEEPSDKLFNVLTSSRPGRVAFLLHQGVANITTGLWQTPASLGPISKKAERKYFVPTKGLEYFYSHPTPNSLVVESVNYRERHRQPAPTPKDKDACRLDSFGRKVYSSASFQLRVANHQALLSRYDFNLWGPLPKFEPSVHEQARKEFRALVEEGAAATKAALQVASDAADMAARSMAAAISMRRASWLSLSGLSAESQSIMQDLPFDDRALFADQTDTRLHGMKDSHTTLQTLGLYVPPAKDKPRPHTSAPQARGRYEPPRKKQREQRLRSQCQSHSAPHPGPSKARRPGKQCF
ncbi:uncharacterized protein LOC117883577 [Trachemys scripta elegans]|uniref:uncharacterized protein LOC117883577 n=1 Tax=Trachemys scripta elegans TaxID=31138 RepID=UPI0015542ED0|nr:uncharacterized protein LOC117883577 [Trachemys scripta elegans]